MQKRAITLLFCILLLAVPLVEATKPLSDMMREYTIRNYYYDEDSFGVDDPDYDGPALHKSANQYVEINVFNIILTPKKFATLQIALHTDEYEAIGELSEGDYYVTRDGIKITVDHIEEGKINFTLRKVSKEQHTILCPQCIRVESLREDDGLRAINVNQECGWAVKGNDYWVSLYDLDRKTAEAKLKINGEILPILQPDQVYVLRDGIGVQFFSSAYHDWGGSDTYGYAIFGFVDTKDIPNRFICPNCTSFVYLKEEQKQDIRIKNKVYPLQLSNKDNALILKYNGDTIKLEENKQTKVNDNFAVVLLKIETGYRSTQYQIGVITEEGKETRVSCKDMNDKGFDFKKKGSIRLYIGSNDNEFEKEDTCIDDKTLVEYACERIPGKELDQDKGIGFTGKITYARCACNKGACKDEPTCTGTACVEKEKKQEVKPQEDRPVLKPAKKDAMKPVEENKSIVKEMPKQDETAAVAENREEIAQETAEEPTAKQGVFGRMIGFFKNLFS